MALLRDGRHVKREFLSLSSNNKDQLKELYKDLNEKLIKAINTLDDSTFADTLIMIKNNQLCYLSTAVISPEAVGNVKSILQQ